MSLRSKLSNWDTGSVRTETPRGPACRKYQLLLVIFLNGPKGANYFAHGEDSKTLNKSHGAKRVRYERCTVRVTRETPRGSRALNRI